ncbi:MAG: hypothetical protein KDA37_11475, partial [Planctomycetales bacterium]|nr:hypothetical protein [Planctomycetales bacterium]
MTNTPRPSQSLGSRTKLVVACTWQPQRRRLVLHTQAGGILAETRRIAHAFCPPRPLTNPAAHPIIRASPSPQLSPKGPAVSDLCDFGLIGLAVMGENLALNVESRGYKVAVYNRTTSVVDDFLNGRAKGKQFIGCHSLEDLVKNLARPRKVMMMVKAGPAVDAVIDSLKPLLEPGDIIIDGG